MDFLIITRDGGAHLEEVLEQSRFFNLGEIVVCVDDRTADDTVEIAEKFTDKVYLLDFGGRDYVEAVINEAHTKCSGEWIFRLDDDELISAEFVNAHEKLLASDDVSGFCLPTYYCVDKWRFINAEPWYPDYHLRLYKRDAIMPHPGHPHVPLQVDGKTERWIDCPVFHMCYLWSSRQKREEKVARGSHRYPSLLGKFTALKVYERCEESWGGKIAECAGTPIAGG